jgi:hypothetical protein
MIEDRVFLCISAIFLHSNQASGDKGLQAFQALALKRRSQHFGTARLRIVAGGRSTSRTVRNANPDAKFLLPNAEQGEIM